jgi:hypothetical protein
MRRTLPLFLVLLPLLSFAEEDPCASLLAVLNRPTVADSVCSVKSGKIIVEGGFQYQATYPDSGYQSNFPAMDLRIGLPDLNEVSVLLPYYIWKTGYTATVLQFKHQFSPNGPWVYAAEGFLTLPTGSKENGSEGFGYTLNGIVEYNFTETLSLSFQYGLSSLTASSNAGGGRYFSVNPDLVFAWQPLDPLQFYVEVYGQSKTGPEESGGFNADAGIQYLISEALEIDLEYGQRLSGELGGFARYVGAGLGVRF